MSDAQVNLGELPMIEILQRRDEDGEEILLAITMRSDDMGTGHCQCQFSSRLLRCDEAAITNLLAGLSTQLRTARETPLDDFGWVP